MKFASTCLFVLAGLSLVAGQDFTNHFNFAPNPTSNRTRAELIAALQNYYSSTGQTNARVFQEGGHVGVQIGRRSGIYPSTALVPGDAAPKLECGGWLNSTNAPDTKGKVVLIDFSATWCGPCVECMPHVQELHARYASRGLVIIMATDEPAGKFEPVARTKRLTMPVALETSHNCVRSSFGIVAWPAAVLINPDGKIIYVGDPRDAALEPAIEAQLKQAQEITAGSKLPR